MKYCAIMQFWGGQWNILRAIPGIIDSTFPSLAFQVTDSIYELMGNGFTTPLTGAAAVGSAAAAAAAAATAASGRASKDERHAHVDRVFQVGPTGIYTGN